jgi:enterochelin esterase-like enzyme
MQRTILVRLVSTLVTTSIAISTSLAHAAEAQPYARGTVLESQEFKSRILGQGVRYSVYLPPGYTENATRRYPVVYLLHGYPTQPVDSETDWIEAGAGDRLTDEAIASGRLSPLILIMPDANTTYYMNSRDGAKRYEDMFVNEFVPFIDRSYRTRAQKVYRGIAGLSMGGFGALMLAMHHPDLFGASAALSPAIRTDQQMMDMSDEEYTRRWAALLGPGLKGEARLNEQWRRYSLLHLATTLPTDQLRETRWYIDIGDDDFLSQGSDALHTALSARKIRHEYRVRDGAHQWSYWRAGLVDALRFVTDRD